MATWKKVIVSGSAAELGSLTLTTKLGVAQGGTGTGSIGANNFLVGTNATTYTHIGSNGTGTVVRTTGATAVKMTGSFTGSFKGDGSQLTGLTVSAVSSYTNPGNNRIITSVDASTINGEANLTFDGSTLSVTGNITASGPITGSRIQLTGLAAGTDNTVLVLNGTNNVVTDEIDARVWGTTLVDNAGGNSANTRVAYWTGSDSLAGNASFTYNGTSLTVGNSTFGTNVFIDGNLTVNGTTTNLNITNISVEDRFILMNSGSSSGDGGFIIQTEATPSGSAFGWDDSASRFGLQIGTTKLAASATTLAPDAYLAAVVDVDAGLADVAAHQQNGNIKISGGEIFIYA